MKGALWEFWIIGVITIFIGASFFLMFTPMLETLNSAAYTAGNFTHTATNTSFHNSLQFLQNQWALVPIIMGALILLIWFIAASDEDELNRRI